MFRPVAMQRLSVVVLERDEYGVLRGLGHLGAVHLVRQAAGPETAPQAPRDRTAELARCDALLARIETLRRRMSPVDSEPRPSGSGPPGTAPSRSRLGSAADLPPTRLDQADRLLKAIEERAADVLARRQATHQRWGQAVDRLEQVAAYEGLDLPMDQFGRSRTSFLHFATGSLPAENLEDLRHKVGENVVLLTLPERGGRRYLVAITSRKGQYALETALGHRGFRHDALGLGQGETVERLAGRTRAEEEQASRDLAQATHAVRTVARESAQALVDLRHVVTTERLILDAEQSFPRTEATVLITGWVQAEEVPWVRRRLNEITSGRCAVEAVDAGGVPEHEVPTLLRHPQFLRPFEMLVANYGLPAYREFVPTLFVAISYVLMFGMMFSDVGHGLVVALAGLALLLKGRAVAVRDAGQLMLCLGLSSVGFGIYDGSYFGVTEIGGHELGHDPLKGNPLQLMVVAVLFGAALMSLGLVLNIVNRLRHGDLLGALMGRFGLAGVVFYWGCLGLLVCVVAQRAGDVPGWVAALVIALPLLAVALKGPLHVVLAGRRAKAEHAGAHAEGGMGEAVIESAVEALEAILGYLANTISFVRLAAYALSHAAVLMASFAIAAEFEKALGGAGAVLGVMVIVLGNGVAILLEGVVAAVQALRLEYYEFFGKFFSGAGLAFKPFRFPAREQGLSSQG